MFWNRSLRVAAVLGAAVAPAVHAAACQSPLTSELPAPVTRNGYTVNLIADGFSYPRGIVFDSKGHLLVADQTSGIKIVDMRMDDNGCVMSSKTEMLIDDATLNHGLQLSADGKTLYASSMENVWSWPYDAESMSVDDSQKMLLIKNMSNTDHTTRTLLLSTWMPDLLLVARGSGSNVDKQAMDEGSGHSQLKAFNINNMTRTYDFVHDGMLLGWGIRNDVGVAEEPTMGGIYTVENSVDEMERLGKDIHNTNPGEELNYFGTLKDNQSPNQGANFGYPECYSAWGVADIPQRNGLKVGEQFAIGDGDDIAERDQVCRNERVAPRLVFDSHMAPLDILFDTNGTAAWVTFHGSWNRDPPAGYKLSVVSFADGEPVEPSTSLKAAVDMVWNEDVNDCPDKCFRPVGLAWDAMGRLWFSSDATGEIYMLMRNSAANGAVDGAPVDSDAPAPQDDAAGVVRASASLAAAVVAGAALLLM